MSEKNYTSICSNLLKTLQPRQKEIIARRFGLAGKRKAEAERETLEAIGKSQRITRERVRQIEKEGLVQLKSNAKELKPVFQEFSDYLKKQGGLKKEDLLLEKFSPDNKNQIFFLLNLSDQFERFSGTEDFHAFWSSEKIAFEKAVKSVGTFFNKLDSVKKLSPAPKNIVPSHLEISKKIQKTEEGIFGLKSWPEVSPRGVKDKAFLVFKKEQKPLHFTEVAALIGKNALPQTVHNELIKDDRFVLVGRGIYALQEWGYESGVVKDVIVNLLKNSKKPLSKEEILEGVLKQRFVKENTIFLNLADRNRFLKNEKGFYSLNNVKTA